MPNIKRHIQASLHGREVFYLILFVYLTLLGTALLIWGYKDSFLYLNGGQYHWLDWPMFIITHLGDSSILVAIVCLILIKNHPDTALKVILIVIITGFIGQILKQTIFDGWDRPLRIFADNTIIYALPHYRLFHNSFPSGHSITAATVFTILVIDQKPKFKFQIAFAAIVILITYSRVYLGVHFPGDVLAGILIGMLLTILVNGFINGKLARLNYSKTFQTIIIILAVISLLFGIWMLKGYLPFSG